MCAIPVIDMTKTGQNIVILRKRAGLSVRDLQEYLGLGCVQSVYRGIDGVNMPTIDNLYALSELLQVPIDAIVCGNRAPIVSERVVKAMTPEARRLYAYYEKLNEKHAA